MILLKLRRPARRFRCAHLGGCVHLGFSHLLFRQSPVSKGVFCLFAKGCNDSRSGFGWAVALLHCITVKI